jgi:hypothetical protein
MAKSRVATCLDRALLVYCPIRQISQTTTLYCNVVVARSDQVCDSVRGGVALELQVD